MTGDQDKDSRRAGRVGAGWRRRTSSKAGTQAQPAGQEGVCSHHIVSTAAAPGPGEAGFRSDQLPVRAQGWRGEVGHSWEGTEPRQTSAEGAKSPGLAARKAGQRQRPGGQAALWDGVLGSNGRKQVPPRRGQEQPAYPGWRGRRAAFCLRCQVSVVEERSYLPGWS